MTTGWRLVKAQHADGAFTGEGARRFGGRWNRRGDAVVYLADSLSLAALELFVHLGSTHRGLRFATFRVALPETLQPDHLDRSQLPADWRAQPASAACQALGSQWLHHGDAALLALPSVIVPQQQNYLLRSDHPDVDLLSIQRDEDFSFDPRMWKP